MRPACIWRGVIEDATVLVVPKGARVIAAQGMFLLPGLGEMHAHVPAGPNPQYARDDVLFLWVANGVTVARGMLGAPEHLQLRADLAAHRVLGPRLITAGPSLNGNSVQSPEQGALRTATAAPAQFFGAEGAYGTIVVGADADLVLLKKDPLPDIANTQSIEGVLVRGRWLDRAYLDRGLRDIEARMAGGE